MKDKTKCTLKHILLITSKDFAELNPSRSLRVHKKIREEDKTEQRNIRSFILLNSSTPKFAKYLINFHQKTFVSLMCAISNVITNGRSVRCAKCVCRTVKHGNFKFVISFRLIATTESRVSHWEKKRRVRLWIKWNGMVGKREWIVEEELFLSWNFVFHNNNNEKNLEICYFSQRAKLFICLRQTHMRRCQLAY